MSTFEDWKEDYGLVHEPNYSLHTEMDCKHAFKAGKQSNIGEINILKNKIDVALALIKTTNGCCSIKSIESILNGENNDH